MKTNEQILERMGTHNTLVCCGLDPDLSKMPTDIIIQRTSNEEKVFEFLRGVVDVTAPHVCVYKAQKAYFDVMAGGHEILSGLIGYIHESYPGIPVIIDCKIGDVQNTMTIYIQNLFNSLRADGVVVNPYMGDDAILPLTKLTEKSIVVIVKTSNPSGSIVQDVPLRDGRPLWSYILDLVVGRWNYNSNLIPVLSSTVGLDMTAIRPLIPDKMPILLAGVGAQGGDLSELRNLLNTDGIGVFVNSSRNILYPSRIGCWQSSVQDAVIRFKNTLNGARCVNE